MCMFAIVNFRAIMNRKFLWKKKRQTYHLCAIIITIIDGSIYVVITLNTKIKIAFNSIGHTRSAIQPFAADMCNIICCLMAPKINLLFSLSSAISQFSPGWLAALQVELQASKIRKKLFHKTTNSKDDFLIDRPGPVQFFLSWTCTQKKTRTPRQCTINFIIDVCWATCIMSLILRNILSLRSEVP